MQYYIKYGLMTLTIHPWYMPCLKTFRNPILLNDPRIQESKGCELEGVFKINFLNRKT